MSSAIKILLLFLLISNTNLSQNLDSIHKNFYDPSFHTYLHDVKIACLNKDTLTLHQLFGDSIYVEVCCDNLSSMNYDDDWRILKENLNLDNQPQKSKFWDFFLRISEQGFYYDTIFKDYNVPHVYRGGILEIYGDDGKPLYYLLSPFQKIFLNDTINLYVGKEMYFSEVIKFVPKKRSSNKYPYEFFDFNEDYFICKENGIEIGKVSKDDVIAWDVHFSFKKVNERWKLDSFNVCADF